jgi:hypothetical protein
MSRMGIAVSLLATVVGACSSGGGPAGDGGPADAAGGASDVSPGGGDGGSGAAACVAAGGRCVNAVSFCANVGHGATPQSCGPDAVCCAVSADAGCTDIQATSYDQSCAVDSDCTAVRVGNACYACELACYTTIGAVNLRALAQYNVDFDGTPAAHAPCGGCPLSVIPPACCRGGQCHADGECWPTDAATDAADARAQGGDTGSAAAPCSAAADCAGGQICCVTSALNQTPVCQVAPCPYLPGFGVFQLCSTPAECVTAGDICAPQGGGRLPVPICQAPASDGGGGTADAPAGG